MRFGYASDRSKGDEFSNRIIENLPLLKKFNEYFISEMQPVLKSIRDTLVDLPLELGIEYNKPPQGLQKKPTSHDKSLFLDTIGLLEYTKIAKLTFRELDCMKYVAKGFNSIDIAQELDLSKRTVQHYLDDSVNFSHICLNS